VVPTAVVPLALATPSTGVPSRPVFAAPAYSMTINRSLGKVRPSHSTRGRPTGLEHCSRRRPRPDVTGGFGAPGPGVEAAVRPGQGVPLLRHRLQSARHDRRGDVWGAIRTLPGPAPVRPGRDGADRICAAPPGAAPRCGGVRQQGPRSSVSPKAPCPQPCRKCSLSWPNTASRSRRPTRDSAHQRRLWSSSSPGRPSNGRLGTPPAHVASDAEAVWELVEHR